MNQFNQKSKSILITGGTSGLGFELARQFLDKGWSVEATGRNLLKTPEPSEKFRFHKVDFSDLESVAEFGYRITAQSDPFDIIINNAGILSPPDFRLTVDGNEYTFQVNFLSHLLLNQIIINQKPTGFPLRLISVISPVYKFGKIGRQLVNEQEYSRFKDYPDSKLSLALMSRYLTEKYPDANLTAISFDPGVFSSGIYRTQHKWFRKAYNLAAPVMKKSGYVAEKLVEIMDTDHPVNGAIYNRKGKISKLPLIDPNQFSIFRESCQVKIDHFIQ